jgi:arylsulfatase A-like enzyme
MMRFSWRLTVAGAAVMSLLGFLAGHPEGDAGAWPASGAAQGKATYAVAADVAQRPNIVLIMTDDQRTHDLRYMPATRRLLAQHGTSFVGLSHHPLCCPARAGLLTGQYAHNNGVRTVHGPHGYRAFDDSQTVATWLSAAGYRTIFMGKYVNGYPSPRDVGREPGWVSWHPTVRSNPYNYWNFTVRHGSVHAVVRSTYQTDYFTRLAVRQIRRSAPSETPFFLYQAYVAPHGACQPRPRRPCWVPAITAPRHRGLFSRVPLDTRRSPAFNEVDMSDKPRELRALPRFSPGKVRRIAELNRARLGALRAVDEGVAATVRALRAAGELRNTLIIFTSDNGFLLGAHRLQNKKTWGYEPSIGVPLILRGPGIPANRRATTPGTLLDVTATITAAARAAPTLPLDGQDLGSLARGERGRDTVLIVGGPRPGHPSEAKAGWFYRGVRTGRYTYIRYDATAEEELYDRRVDPHQIASVHDNRRYRATLAELQRRTIELRTCVGDACHGRFGPVPGPRQ